MLDLIKSGELKFTPFWCSFTLLTKKGNLNLFDLHKHPLNGQICQADGSRRLAVASLRRVTVGALHVVGQATSQKAAVFSESSQASVWRLTCPLSTIEPKIYPPSCSCLWAPHEPEWDLHCMSNIARTLWLFKKKRPWQLSFWAIMSIFGGISMALQSNYLVCFQILYAYNRACS